jgi:hypothetical protein
MGAAERFVCLNLIGRVRAEKKGRKLIPFYVPKQRHAGVAIMGVNDSSQHTQY